MEQPISFVDLVRELASSNTDPQVLEATRLAVLRNFGTINARGEALTPEQQALLQTIIDTIGEEATLEAIAQGAVAHNEETLALYD